MTQTVTLRDVLDLPELEEARVLGGQARVPLPLHDVSVLDLRDIGVGAALPVGGGTLVVLAVRQDEHRRWQHVVDVLLRRIHAAGGGALLVPARAPGQGGDHPAATLLLADRLGVPLVAYPSGLRVLDLGLAARALVRSPEVEEARLLQRLVTHPGGGAEPPEAVLRRLETVLRGRATLVATSGEVVSGHAPDDGLDRILSPTHPSVSRNGDLTCAVLPLSGPGVARVCLERAQAGPRWGSLALRALALVQGDLLVWLAGERIRAERTARHRGTLFTEVVEHGAALSPDVAEEARAAGWALSGWHLGVHVHVMVAASGRSGAGAAGGHLDGFAEAVATAAAVRHVPLSPLVERSDGWTGWLTLAEEPTPATVRDLAARLREVLSAVATTASGLVCAAGLGSAHEGIGGVAATVAEARQAALGATPTGHPVQVRVVDELGASRLLLGWYASGSFRDLSGQILAPLIELGDPDLLTTLSAYLERACSTAHTARALGVHRNTVGQRVTRAERALGASFTHADTRLAVQLALRSLGHHSSARASAS